MRAACPLRPGTAGAFPMSYTPPPTPEQQHRLAALNRAVRRAMRWARLRDALGRMVWPHQRGRR